MKSRHFFLDMDGVLVDFFSSAIHILNKEFKKEHTIQKYVVSNAGWDIAKFYGISQTQFWGTIEKIEDFWLNLKPFPWYRDLYNFLKGMGEVTIVTSPSWDFKSASQKLEWLYNHLGIVSSDVFIGSKKYLMAGNGILIDDAYKNIAAFRENGGKAIQIPSNWNTLNLDFEMIKNKIEKEL